MSPTVPSSMHGRQKHGMICVFRTFHLSSDSIAEYGTRDRSAIEEPETDSIVVAPRVTGILNQQSRG